MIVQGDAVVVKKRKALTTMDTVVLVLAPPPPTTTTTDDNGNDDKNEPKALAAFEDFELSVLPALLKNEYDDYRREMLERDEMIEQGLPINTGGVYFAWSDCLKCMKIGATRRDNPYITLREISLGLTFFLKTLPGCHRQRHIAQRRKHTSSLPHRGSSALVLGLGLSFLPSGRGMLRLTLLQ